MLEVSQTQVTRKNFEDVLPEVAAGLDDCDFFAFDCEMTGLNETDNSSNYMDDIEDRYRQVCACCAFLLLAMPAQCPFLTTVSGTWTICSTEGPCSCSAVGLIVWQGGC